jgi:hypothetical protein
MNLRRGAAVLGMTSAVALGGLLAPSVASAGEGDHHYTYEECKDLWEEIDSWEDKQEWWDKCGDRFGNKFDWNDHDDDKKDDGKKDDGKHDDGKHDDGKKD